jgi:hypothetical protein
MANGAFYSDIKEELGLGKGYVYVSKNAVDDTLAAANFGKAAAWVSGAAVVLNQRVVSVSIQYKNITGTNTSTAPASDPTNWAFDFENYQPYLTSKTYNTGNKTTINNLHYTCNSDGVTGAFNVANWTQVPISNKSCPYRLMNTAIVMINADARFVSYELLDTILNKAYHNIYLLISNGVWSESLTVPTKYIRCFGQSKWKTSFNLDYDVLNLLNYWFFQNLKFKTLGVYGNDQNLKAQNVVFESFLLRTSTNIKYCYKCCFQSISSTFNSNNIITHMVNCTLASNLLSASDYYLTINSILKNNIYATGTLAALTNVLPGNCDNNSFSTTTILNAIKAAYPLQNANSVGGATYVATNADYTLAVGSPCIGIGANGNNIGAEGVGYSQTNATIFDSANGAIYNNVKKLSTAIVRDQIGKQVVSATSNTVVLDASASAVDDIYIGNRLYDSTGTGDRQTVTITAYNGTTKEATVSPNLTTVWDNSTYYEMLDGYVTSAIGDLGSVQVVGKLNNNTVNYFDVPTSTIITQNVSSADCRNIGSSLTYDLKVGLLADLSDGVWKKFLQDEPLIMDASGYGCGDTLFNPQTIASSTLTFRYYQIGIGFHK